MEIDEQFKKEIHAFRSSPYSYTPSNKNWSSVLKMMHNFPATQQERANVSLLSRLEDEIERSYKNRDINYLKKVFPTAEDLIAHGSALWVMTHTPNADKDSSISPIDFIKEIFRAYDLDNMPELKAQFLLQRGPNRKYATDKLLPSIQQKYDLQPQSLTEEERLKLAANYIARHGMTISEGKITIKGGTSDERQKQYEELKKFLSHSFGITYQNNPGKQISEIRIPENHSARTILKKILDVSPSLYDEQNIELYQFLKEQIQAVQPPQTKEEIHRIGEINEDNRRQEDKQADGTPVSGGLWLVDDEGNRVAYMDGSIKETYPEIRLRNIGDENKREQSVILTELDPNSDKSLVEQVITELDFPEDFAHHFKALSIWEKDYQEARKDEQRFAYIRYFVQNRGAYIFEDQAEKGFKGNAKEGIDYGGYAGYRQENGEKYPRIVVRSDYMRDEPDKAYFHELYHRVDLHNGLALSTQDITKYTFMLAQMDESNSFKRPFQIVDEVYPPTEFNKEVLARIMSYESDEPFKDSPLLSEFYKTGKLFALAKADKVPSMEHRIQYALYNMSEMRELQDMHYGFMKDKYTAYEKEEELRKQYSGAELKEQLSNHNNQIKKKNSEKNLKNEPNRARLEAALLKRLQVLNQELSQIHQNKVNFGHIILPPSIIAKYQELNISNKKTNTETYYPEFYIYRWSDKEKKVTSKTLSEQIDKFENAVLNNSQPHIQFLRLYMTIDTLNKLGYNYLYGIPTLNKLAKEFDELLTSSEKRDILIDKLSLVSEEIRKGSSKTDTQLACMFNKSSTELTEDDRLIGYLKNGYATRDDLDTLTQTFIKKLEQNGYDPVEISEVVFENIEYDDQDNETIKNISFPADNQKAKRIIDYLDKNYSIETLRKIARYTPKIIERIPEENKYRKPYILYREDDLPIMFRSEYEAKKYLEGQKNNQTKETSKTNEGQQNSSQESEIHIQFNQPVTQNNDGDSFSFNSSPKQPPATTEGSAIFKLYILKYAYQQNKTPIVKKTNVHQQPTVKNNGPTSSKNPRKSGGR